MLQFDFGSFVPEGFVFSPDGRFLYGSSYYTGISNIFRYEIATGDIEAVSKVAKPANVLLKVILETAALDLAQIALASNFKMAVTIASKQELIKVLKEFKNQKGPLLILIKTRKGTRSDLKRPSKTPIKLKEEFLAGEYHYGLVFTKP